MIGKYSISYTISLTRHTNLQKTNISLVIKIQLFCEHRNNARNLFLCMKIRVKGKGLKFDRYLSVNPSKNVHELELVCVLFQHSAE